MNRNEWGKIKMKKFDRTRVVSVLVHQRANSVESMKSVKKGWGAFCSLIHNRWLKTKFWSSIWCEETPQESLFIIIAVH